MSEQQKMDQERAALQARIAALEAGQDSLRLVRDEYKRMADEYRGKWAALLARAGLPVGVPDGYALVPVEPTPEMVSAAEEAHMPFGEMDIALRMAILSAPTAQPAAQQSPTVKESLTVAEQSAPDHAEDALEMVEQSAPGEVEDGVDFGFDDRSVRVSQEAYSIFLDREQVLRDDIAALEGQLAARDAGEVRVPVELLSVLASEGLSETESDRYVDAVMDARALLAQRERGGE